MIFYLLIIWALSYCVYATYVDNYNIGLRAGFCILGLVGISIDTWKVIEAVLIRKMLCQKGYELSMKTVIYKMFHFSLSDTKYLAEKNDYMLTPSWNEGVSDLQNATNCIKIGKKTAAGKARKSR